MIKPEHFDRAVSIVDGRLSMICPRMRLLVSPALLQVAHEGMGTISADEYGRLVVRMTIARNAKLGPSVTVPGSVGAVPSPYDFVVLVAEDTSGQEWRSDRLLLHISALDDMRGYVVFVVRSLTSGRTADRSSSTAASVLIPQLRGLPFSHGSNAQIETASKERREITEIDRTVLQIDGRILTFRRYGEHWLVVEIEIGDDVSPEWPGLLCHAIGVALGVEANPVVVARNAGECGHVTIYSGPWTRYLSYMPRVTYEVADENPAEGVWQFVAKLHSFLLGEKDAGPLLEELSGILRGAASSMRGAALTLGVGVEATVGMIVDGPAVSLPSKNDIETLRALIESASIDGQLKRRATGMLGSLGQVRAVDKLYAWSGDDPQKKRLVASWKKLRNVHAHGNAESTDQELLDNYYATIELLFRLLADRAGYVGPILDSASLRGATIPRE